MAEQEVAATAARVYELIGRCTLQYCEDWVCREYLLSSYVVSDWKRYKASKHLDYKVMTNEFLAPSAEFLVSCV